MSLGLFLSSLSRMGAVQQPNPTGEMLASVSLHRYGAVMTFNQNTDTLGVNKYPSEFWAMKYNIKPTAFVSRYNGADNTLTGFGRVEKSIYFQTDRWHNGSSVQLIPDYNSTTWSSAGAAVFNVTAGQSKPDRYPNHGQQMYDISGGGYGWDSASGAGSNNLAELTGLIEAEKSQYTEAPYTFSYRNGRNDTPQVYEPYFLGGRNSYFSTSGDSNTSYGAGAGLPNNKTARLDYVNRASATRFADFETGVSSLGIPSGGTYADSLAYLEQELLKTVNSKGFFQDFMHWHTAGTKVRDMYAKVREVLAPYDVHYAGYEEALRYMWTRQAVQAVSVSGNTVSLTWNSFDLPEALTVPVSIKIDTTGTDLAGKDITSSVGEVLKKSANVFIVEVPYNTASFTISEASTPSYIDLAAPVIGFELSGTTLTVTTDKPCKVALWKATAGASEADLGAPDRSNVFQTQHTFTVNSTEQAGDLYIGALSERGQSAMVQVG
ncbi:hypothetical protein [Pontibacter mangrovi]|uniref:Uncharacterized protein n=1 Tax=Pontibacter mangrovi TaxID=2589816 RepID=A0A501W5P4_9BACT|nr:hypothetical protein [Pontibacter mangrovi]TPE43965.1 hypothetical protein FJM65_11105 [Pontibacter mangrovi]